MSRLRSPSRRCLNRCLTAPGLVALWAAAAAWAGLFNPAASLAGPTGREVPLAVPLRCRVGDGPWQGCVMEVEQPGARWALVVGERRFGFRHDGSGTVRMQNPQRGLPPGSTGEAWIPVETSWISGPALCWNGVCAQGDIPLD